MNSISTRMLLVLSVLGLFLIIVPLAEAAWTPSQCQWTVVNKPVTGGTLNGRGCLSWWDGAELLWRIWGDTYAPFSYDISTLVNGYDTCDGGAHWVFQMTSNYHDDFNASHGTSGGWKSGPYQNCTSSHTYRVEGSHFRKKTSSSGWEGGWGNAYW